MNLIPTTVLTGFLGSGKSTLLKRILTEAHGQKIAVIENEFGEENIDGEILTSGKGEQIIQLSNGCICCTIRDDLRVSLEQMAQKRESGEIIFDRLVIETTGLADPGPIAQTFFLEDRIARRYRPDAIVTMVDAKFGMHQLDDRSEARRQVGFADRILLSKTDLVPPETVERLSARLARINPRATQIHAMFGAVALSDVFDVGGFNLSAELELSRLATDSCSSTGTHAHHDAADGYVHDDIGSFVFRAERPLHAGRFGQFLNAMISTQGQRLLRYKGVLCFEGIDRKVIFQGVHQLTSSDLGPRWRANELRHSKMVFIGLHLPEALILNSLQRCLTRNL